MVLIVVIMVTLPVGRSLKLVVVRVGVKVVDQVVMDQVQVDLVSASRHTASRPSTSGPTPPYHP